MTRAYYMTPREKVLHTAQFSFDLLFTGFCLSTTLSVYLWKITRQHNDWQNGSMVKREREIWKLGGALNFGGNNISEHYGKDDWVSD